MRARYIIWPLVALTGGGAAVYSKWFRPIAVNATTVTRGVAVEAVYASGTVEAEDRVDVKARLSGPLTALHVREGDSVQENQLLARIDVPALDLDVSRGRVDLMAARERATLAPQITALEAQAQSLATNLAQAKADLQRADKLLAAGAGVALDAERARTQVESLEAQIRSNRAQQQDLRIGLRSDTLRQRAGVETLKARARDVEVRSPMDGVVLSRRVEKGEVVAVNQNLLRIGDLSRLWLESRVDEGDIGRVRVQMPATVRLYAFEGQVFHAHVTRILPDADRDRKSFEVDLVLDAAPKGLLPGMTAEINIIIRKREGTLVIPADAVHEVKAPSGQPRHHVWVVDAAGQLAKQPIKIGIRDLVQVEVVEGVSEGQRVITDDEERLVAGRKARVTMKSAPSPGPASPSGSGGGSL